MSPYDAATAADHLLDEIATKRSRSKLIENLIESGDDRFVDLLIDVATAARRDSQQAIYRTVDALDAYLADEARRLAEGGPL